MCTHWWFYNLNNGLLFQYLTNQSFTSESLYYRLKIQDKDLVDIDIKHYLQYLIQIINPVNLEKLNEEMVEPVSN